MDQLTGMRLFAEVVESGSFSGAGRRLGLAPSSVSRQINQLEDALDARLLNRSTRKLSLTEAGRIYVERVRRILQEIDEATIAVSQLEATPRGTLRVNAPVVFGRMHVAPLLPEFMGRFPDVAIDLTLTDHFVDVVEEGADVVVRVGGLADSSLIARRLAPNRRVLCASPAYLEAHGSPVEPADLGLHNCLIYKPNVGMATWHVRSGNAVARVQVAGNFLANNAEALRSAALGGIGIGLLPTWLVGDDVACGGLVRLLPDVEADLVPTETAIHAVYPHSRHLSPKVRAFVDFLARRYGSEPYWEQACGGDPDRGTIRGPHSSVGAEARRHRRDMASEAHNR
jgi:DNA-binding transcriptional LysR family regulator